MAMLSSAFPHRSSWESRSSRGLRPLVRFTRVLGLVHLIEILSATFRELGPPDLCHVIKSTARAGQREVSAASSSKNTKTLVLTVPTLHPPTLPPQTGSYHYVSGIDTSSSASLAAYINSLTYSIEESQAWFAKGPTWKVKNGCFWCVFFASRPHGRMERYSRLYSRSA